MAAIIILHYTMCLADISRDYIKLLAEEVGLCDSSGFQTRQLVSRVETRLVVPDGHDIGVSYCRLLLGDTLVPVLKPSSFDTRASYVST